MGCSLLGTSLHQFWFGRPQATGTWIEKMMTNLDVCESPVSLTYCKPNRPWSILVAISRGKACCEANPNHVWSLWLGDPWSTYGGFSDNGAQIHCEKTAFRPFGEYIMLWKTAAKIISSWCWIPYPHDIPSKYSIYPTTPHGTGRLCNSGSSLSGLGRRVGTGLGNE